jgi:type IV pilus assembly protein PilV
MHMASRRFQGAPSGTARRARGVMLIEALIAILIFSIGVLGMIGLQASAVQQSTDAKNRAEAASLAGQLMGQMWASDRTAGILKAQFDSDFCGAGGCPAYAAWANAVKGVLPGVSLTADTKPTVDVQDAGAQPGLITISLFWRAPSDDPSSPMTRHRYDLQAQIGQ